MPVERDDGLVEREWTWGRLEAGVTRRFLVVGLSERTRREYSEEAASFQRWFERSYKAPPTLADLTIENADRYLAEAMLNAEVAGRTWAPDTVGHHVAQLRAFAGHAATVARLPSNPLAQLRGPKRSALGDRQGDGLEDDEALAVLEAAGGPRLGDLVDQALFVLGYEDGPRRSEYATIEVTDLRLADRLGQPLGWVLDLRTAAKGGKPRTLPLGIRAEGVLRALVGRRTSGPLFPSRDGSPLSGERIGERLGQLGKCVGIRLTPQRLRRSASSWQAAYGASSGHLDTVFGWAPNPIDVKSGHYIKPTLSQLLLAHQTQLSPLDRLEHRVGPLPLG